MVVNLAVHGVDPGQRDSTLMRALNTDLPRELCDCLAREPTRGWSGTRLVHVGSALEYGDVRGTLVESMPEKPTTEYGRSKLAATRYITEASRVSGLSSAVVRLFTVYGPGEHEGRLLPSLTRLAREGGRLPLTAGEQRRDFTYVEDVAEGLLRLATSTASPGTIVNLATGRLISVRTFVETAATVMRIPPSALAFGELPTRAEEMHHDEVSLDRLFALTSWRPTTAIAEGIQRSWDRHHVRA
jgi:nucleoside-diphosphate-sugar epimerase